MGDAGRDKLVLFIFFLFDFRRWAFTKLPEFWVWAVARSIRLYYALLMLLGFSFVGINSSVIWLTSQSSRNPNHIRIKLVAYIL